MKLKNWVWRVLVVLALLGTLEACSKTSSGSRKKPHGKLKKGGRIPCPIKDC
ncbi:MAG: hypothetical protein MUE85_04745 [Microscillaceae bacterium]|nr:hypothetical protein [Microscillaceae bacterium]